jgi:hypothetical protein
MSNEVGVGVETLHEVAFRVTGDGHQGISLSGVSRSAIG